MQKDEDIQKQFPGQLHPSPTQHNQKTYKQYVKSPHIDQYYFSFKESEVQRSLDQYSIKFFQNGINYLSQYQTPFPYSIRKFYESKNMKIINFQVIFSKFQILIKVLNLCQHDNIQISFQKWINQGMFGNVYSINFNDKVYAIKQIPFSKKYQNSMESIIRQFAVLKVSASLQAAPPCASIYGFDIVTTERAAYFCSEKGQNLSYFIKQHSKSQQFQLKFKQLKKSLMLLHSLSITHNDIKPQNIVFSPSLKKLVFIDFGLSQFHMQTIGFMKKQQAKGSLFYCCDQMKQAFLSPSHQGVYVDMYYNDYISFQKAKQIIQLKINLEQIHHQQSHYSPQNQYNDQQIYNYIYGYQKDIFDGQHVLNSFEKKKNSQREKQQYQCIYIIYIIFLIYERNLVEFEEISKMNPIITIILNKYLAQIYFIFFETGTNFTHFKFIQKFVQILNLIPNSITYQTQDIITNWLLPYIEKISESNNKLEKITIAQTYMQSQKLSIKVISKRYPNPNYHQKWFINELIGTNQGYFENGQLRKIKVRSLQNLSQYIELLTNQMTKISPISIYSAIDDIKIKADYFTRENDINNNEHNQFFQKLLQKIGLQFQFEIQQFLIEQSEIIPQKKNLRFQDQLSNCNQHKHKDDYDGKYLFYLTLFSSAFIKLANDFNIAKQIGFFIIKSIYDNHERFSTKYQEFISILIRQIYSLSITLEQSQIQNTNHYIQTQQERKNYFLSQNFVESILFQNCLSGFDKIFSIIYRTVQYSKCKEIGQAFVFMIDKKIKEICYTKAIFLQNSLKYKTSDKDLLQPNYCIDIFFTILIAFRKKILLKLVGYQQKYTQIKDLVRYYSKIFNLKKQITFKSEQYYEQLSLKWKMNSCLDFYNQRLQQGKCVNFKILKQLYSLYIYNHCIPIQLSQHFNLLEINVKYYNKVKQLHLQKIQGQIIEAYLLSTILKIALYQYNFKIIMEIINHMTGSNSSILDDHFIFVIYMFFRNINYTRKQNEIKKNIKYFSKQSLNSYSYVLNTQNNYQIKFNKQQQTLISQQVLQSQHNSKLNGKMKCSNFQSSIVEEISKQWAYIGQNFKKQNTLLVRLYNFRAVLKKIVSCKFINKQQICIQYFKKYQQQFLKYQKLIQQYLDLLYSDLNLPYQIPKLFGQESTTLINFKNIRQKQFLIYQKLKIVRDVLEFAQFSQNENSIVIQKEWNKIQIYAQNLFESIIDKIPIYYYQCNYQMKKKFYLKQKQKQQKQIHHSEYQDSIFKFLIAFSKFEQNIKKKSKEINHTQLVFEIEKGIQYFNQKKNQQISQNITKNSDKKRGIPNTYVSILLDMLQNNVCYKDDFLILIFKDKFKSLNQQNISRSKDILIKQLIIEELKICFESQVKANKVFKFFYFDLIEIKWLQVLVSSGVKSMFKIKEYGKLKIENRYFLTFVFKKIFAFTNQFSCSHYSFFVLGLVKEFLVNFINQLKIDQGQKFLLISKNLSQFQTDVHQNMISEQNQLRQFYILLLACQKIKWLYLLENSKLNSKQQYFGGLVTNTSKIIHQISIKLNKMQLILKSFLKNQLYYFLLLIYELDKKNKSFYFKSIIQTISKKKINSLNRETNYFQLKYFRSCRKTQNQRNASSAQCKDKFYSNFNSCDQNFVKKKMLRKFQCKFLKNQQKQGNLLDKIQITEFQIIKKVFKSKIQKLFENL